VSRCLLGPALNPRPFRRPRLDFESRHSRRVGDFDELDTDREHATGLVGALVEPTDRLDVRICESFRNPDNDVSFDTRGIGDDLPQMGVIGRAVLVFDRDRTAVGGERPDIEPKSTNRNLRMLGDQGVKALITITKRHRQLTAAASNSMCSASHGVNARSSGPTASDAGTVEIRARLCESRVMSRPHS